MSETLLRLSGVSKAYSDVRALDDVSFDVGRGTIVALLGPNGAGKTTMFGCILGVSDFTGEIAVEGVDVKRQGKEARRRIGYVPQTQALPASDTCSEALEFLAELRAVAPARARKLLVAARLDEQANTRVGHLSGGMRQRLALAAALLSDPPLLLLDEPTGNLDARSQREFHEAVAALRDEGKTIVVATHYLDRLADLADRAIVLDGGRLRFDGSMSALSARASGKSYVVSLNGTSPAAFREALRGVGIGPERLRPAEAGVEEIMLAIGGPEEPR